MAILEVAGRQPVCWPNILEVTNQVKGRLGTQLPAALRLAWNSWLTLASAPIRLVRELKNGSRLQSSREELLEIIYFCISAIYEQIVIYRRFTECCHICVGKEEFASTLFCGQFFHFCEKSFLKVLYLGVPVLQHFGTDPDPRIYTSN